MSHSLSTPDQRAKDNIEQFLKNKNQNAHCLERAWILGHRDPDHFMMLLNYLGKTGRRERLVTYAADEVRRLCRLDNREDLANIIHHAQFAFLRGNCKIQSELIDEAISSHFETRRRDREAELNKVAYLVTFETDPSSTLPTIPVRMARYQKKKFAPVIFLIHDLETVSKHNPKAAEIFRDADEQGLEIIECGLSKDAPPSEIVKNVSERINASGPDALVTHLQIGMYRMITAACDAPVKLGIDHGHPEWYSSTSLDVCLAGSEHNAQEALCPSIRIPRIIPDLDQRKTMKPVQKNQDILTELNIPDSNFVFLSSGTAPKFGNPTYWKMVREVLRLSGITWVFVGIGPDLLAGQFTKAEMEKCRFLGFRQDFAEILSVADLYVDTFPVGGGEALARAAYMGKPIVTHIADITGIFDKSKSYSAKADLFSDSPLALQGQDPNAYLKLIVNAYQSEDVREQAVKEQKKAIQKVDGYKQRAHLVARILKDLYNETDD